MESLETVTGLLKTVIKASEAANAATESLRTTEEELVKFFNAMYQEIIELESEKKNLLIEIEELKKDFETNSEPIENPAN